MRENEAAALRQLGVASPFRVSASLFDTPYGPGFESAWGEVQTQLQAEGASQDDIAFARSTMTSTYDQLARAANVSNASDAIDAAKQFTVSARTAIGAVSNIAGLISVAKSGNAPPGEVVQLFGGTLIGVASAAGAVSAGVGAAIIVGLALVAEGLNALFAPPSGTTICGETWSGKTPTYAVGCWPMFGPPTASPTAGNGPNPSWIKFPTRVGDITPAVQNGNWLVDWYAPFTLGNFAFRPIDRAFPAWHHLECERDAGSATRGTTLKDVGIIRGAAIYDFMGALRSAWITNAERALNGQKPAADWQVLAQTVDVWNKTRLGNDFFEFPASGTLLNPRDPCPAAGDLDSFVSTLTADLAHGLSGGRDIGRIMPNGRVRINVGPPRDIPQKVSPPVVGGASSSMSTTKKVMLVGAGGTAAVLAGSYAYARLVAKKSFGAFWRGVWQDVKRGARSL